MEDNKTIINPDEKLNELLDLNEGDKLIFNIQKYLKTYIKLKAYFIILLFYYFKFRIYFYFILNLVVFIIRKITQWYMV